MMISAIKLSSTPGAYKTHHHCHTRSVLWKFEVTLLNRSLPTTVAMVGMMRAPHSTRVAEMGSDSGPVSAGTRQPRMSSVTHRPWSTLYHQYRLSNHQIFIPLQELPLKVHISRFRKHNDKSSWFNISVPFRDVLQMSKLRSSFYNTAVETGRILRSRSNIQ